jgi:uncharacterized protein
MFEFDPEKSAANLDKHGIDFETAQALWRDVNRLEFDARSDVEARSGVTGLIDDKHWTAFTTMRGDYIRIISVRRSRDEEVRQYGSQTD